MLSAYAKPLMTIAKVRDLKMRRNTRTTKSFQSSYLL